LRCGSAAACCKENGALDVAAVFGESDRIKVLMLGEALDRPGGLVAVEKAILALPSTRLAFGHIPTLPRSGRWPKIRMFANAVRATITKLVRVQIDIVHIHVSIRGSLYRKAILTVIALGFGKPIIMHTHGGEFADVYPTLSRPMQKLLRSIFERCAVVVALSEAWRRFYVDVMGLPSSRVVVLMNPVTLPPHVPERSQRLPIRCLFLGMMCEIKGIYDLIEAMGVLRDRNVDAHLTVAGHGDVDTAKAMVVERQLRERVSILGWVNTEERNELLRRSHIFVLPSHFEALPMAVLEAMSWELPVITTPVGGIPDVISDDVNGILVQPRNVCMLADAIAALAHDPARRRRLGQRGRERVEPLSAANFEKALISIYEHAMYPIARTEPARIEQNAV